MKKYFLLLLIVIQFVKAYSEYAGIAGIVNTNRTINVKGFLYPDRIWTVYIPNNPAEQALIIAYVAYKKNGKHKISIEFFDKNNKKFDECLYKPDIITNSPTIYTKTCNWGGRLPYGGITFKVFDEINGYKTEIGSLYLPSKE